MAVQPYIDQSDRSVKSGVASEEVFAGELVVSNDGSVSLLEFADGDYDGLAVYDPEFMAAEDEDAIANDAVESGDLVRFAPKESAARLYIRLIPDEGGSAPAVGHDDVVGFVDDAAGDAPSGAVGRIVQEGYSNGATTFNRSNNNFIAIGEAYRPAKQNGEDVTDFDVPIRVELGETEA